MKILLLLALSLPSAAQTAKVIQLTPDDAIQAKTLYDAQIALDKQKADFHTAIVKKYLVVKRGDKDWGDQGVVFSLDSAGITVKTSYRAGWGYGNFEYSEDFKFIVPVPVPTPYSSSYWNACNVIPTSGSVMGVLTTGDNGLLTY